MEKEINNAKQVVTYIPGSIYVKTVERKSSNHGGVRYFTLFEYHGDELVLVHSCLNGTGLRIMHNNTVIAGCEATVDEVNASYFTSTFRQVLFHLECWLKKRD